MVTKAKLIYKSHMTYFHTFLPVYFYGMPNGKVYCMYAQFYGSGVSNSELEFVFAEHEDFSFDYHSGKINGYGQNDISLNLFKEMVEQPEPRIRNITTSAGFESYAEAQNFLDNSMIELKIGSAEYKAV